MSVSRKTEGIHCICTVCRLKRKRIGGGRAQARRRELADVVGDIGVQHFQLGIDGSLGRLVAAFHIVRCSMEEMVLPVVDEAPLAHSDLGNQVCSIHEVVDVVEHRIMGIGWNFEGVAFYAFQ